MQDYKRISQAAEYAARLITHDANKARNSPAVIPEDRSTDGGVSPETKVATNVPGESIRPAATKSVSRRTTMLLGRNASQTEPVNKYVSANLSYVIFSLYE